VTKSRGPKRFGPRITLPLWRSPTGIFTCFPLKTDRSRRTVVLTVVFIPTEANRKRLINNLLRGNIAEYFTECTYDHQPLRAGLSRCTRKCRGRCNCLILNVAASRVMEESRENRTVSVSKFTNNAFVSNAIITYFRRRAGLYRLVRENFENFD